MPLCATGSERRPDAPENIVITPQLALGMLPPAAQWLFQYLPFMQPISISVDDFCTLEPVPWEIPTAIELAALLARGAGGTAALAFEAGNKLASIIHHFAWYSLCRCIDLSVLTPPAAPTAPTGAPANNSGGGTFQVGQPCATVVINGSIPDKATTYNGPYIAYPAGVTHVAMFFSAENPTYPIILGAHSYQDSTMGTLTAIGPRISKAAYNGIYNIAGQIEVYPPNGALFHKPSGAGFAARLGANGSVSSYADAPASFEARMEFYCGSTPGTPPTSYNPCESCPPDPYLDGQLGQLMLQLQALRADVELIQRQAVPFASIDGASTSVTGSGHLDVSSLLGARLAVTAMPSHAVGVVDGEPETLFGLGWFRWGDDDGYGEREFLSSTTTLSLPRYAGAMTRLGYSLPPGVTVLITRVLREP